MSADDDQRPNTPRLHEKPRAEDPAIRTERGSLAREPRGCRLDSESSRRPAKGGSQRPR